MKVIEKVPNGKLIAMEVQFLQGKVSHMKITGDFFLYPEEQIKQVEDSFLELPVNISDAELSSKLQHALKDAELIGVSIDDLVRLFRKAVSL
ncbi:MAG: hypothetical protein ABID61_03010 [Candidatus Micrarchaeota archaeon]